MRDWLGNVGDLRTRLPDHRTTLQRVRRKAAPDGPTDLAGDGTVGASDLAILLGSWG